MQELYLIGTLPVWLVALIGVGTAALLLQQFFGLKKRLPVGQIDFSHAAARGRLCRTDFLSSGSGVDRQARDQTAPAADSFDRQSQSMAFPAGAKTSVDGKPAKAGSIWYARSSKRVPIKTTH